MKLSFHQHIALFWMIGAPGVFAPVIENAKRPDAGAVMAWGVAIVAVMILFTPLLLRCPPFSTWYPIGVMLLVFASRPLGRLIRQRAQERRK